MVQDKKPIMKPSTLHRLATTRISKQVSTAQSKTIQTSKASLKAAGEIKKSVVNGRTKKASLSKKSNISRPDSSLPSKSNISEKVDAVEISTLPEAVVTSSPAPVLAVESHTKGKILKVPESLVSDMSDKKDSLIFSAKITSFPAVADTKEVKELQIPLDENKEKMISHSEVDISTDKVVAEGKTTSDEEPSDLKALEKTTDGVVKSSSDGTHTSTKDNNDTITQNTKQAKATSVTFSSTTKVSEIPASTPPSSIGFSPEHIPSRKKWDNKDYYNSNSAKVAKGFKKLLMFGRKTRPISYA